MWLYRGGIVDSENFDCGYWNMNKVDSIINVQGRPCLQSLTSGLLSDFGVMPPLVPVLKISKKKLGSPEKFGRKWGSNF